MLRGYKRPDIKFAEYLDELDTPIPYGERWYGEPDSESYSVTQHPERFAPVQQVARALLSWMQEQFEVRCFDDPGLAAELRIPPDTVVSSVRILPVNSRCAPLGMILTTFPGVHLELGALYHAVFPTCGCDACDEHVPEMIEELEAQVGAAVSGTFGESLDIGAGRLVHRFVAKETGFSEQSGGLDDISPAQLPKAQAILPPNGAWEAWPRR
ncbi:hypothetical protein RN04_07020 [Arthrobacter sp. W1]|nr:hypothetical protein RN04_07020 [Arthrobacter sp. W1]